MCFMLHVFLLPSNPRYCESKQFYPFPVCVYEKVGLFGANPYSNWSILRANRVAYRLFRVIRVWAHPPHIWANSQFIPIPIVTD